jgi:hypothetical protein
MIDFSLLRSLNAGTKEERLQTLKSVVQTTAFIPLTQNGQ